MIYLLIDLVTFNLTGFNLALFLFVLHDLKPISLINCLLLLLVLNGDILQIVLFLIMYLIDKVMFKYLNYSLLLMISSFTFFYMIFYPINAAYFINLILVILLYFKKYNFSGEINEVKKIRI